MLSIKVEELELILVGLVMSGSREWDVIVSRKSAEAG